MHHVLHVIKEQLIVYIQMFLNKHQQLHVKLDIFLFKINQNIGFIQYKVHVYIVVMELNLVNKIQVIQTM